MSQAILGSYLGGLLKRLQEARAETENDLEQAYAQQASARDELRSRFARNELSEKCRSVDFSQVIEKIE